VKINRREAVLAWCTLVVVALGGTYWWGQPAWQEWKGFTRDSDSLRRRQRIAQKLLDEQPQVEARMAELRKRLPSYPANRDMSDEMQRLLQQTARETSLTLNRGNPRGEKNAGVLYELALEYTWEADLEPLVRFLYALQTRDVILDIRKLRASPVPGQPGRLKGSFTVDCAYTREEADAAPASPGAGPGAQP